MDYKNAIIEMLEKVKKEATFKRVYKLLEYLYLREDKWNADKRLQRENHRNDNRDCRYKYFGISSWICKINIGTAGGINVEQTKQGLENMMQKIYENEKALQYMHKFVKLFIERYL